MNDLRMNNRIEVVAIIIVSGSIHAVIMHYSRTECKSTETGKMGSIGYDGNFLERLADGQSRLHHFENLPTDRDFYMYYAGDGTFRQALLHLFTHGKM